MNNDSTIVNNISHKSVARKKSFIQRGFTLLEVIIVIIVIGVLASLSIPRLTANIKNAYLVEALQTLGVMSRAMNMCATENSGDYSNCFSFDALAMQNPSLEPGARFNYSIFGAWSTGYSFIAELKAEYVQLEEIDLPWGIKSAYAMMGPPVTNGLMYQFESGDVFITGYGIYQDYSQNP